MKLKNLFAFTAIAIICNSCNSANDNQFDNIKQTSNSSGADFELSVPAILKSLDHSIDSDYGSFCDLGNGYFELANCRLSLFKDSTKWAIVFEKFGYNARAGHPVLIELNYFGNCLQNLPSYQNQEYNVTYIEIDNDINDFMLDENRKGIIFRGHKVAIPRDENSYSRLGIPFSDQIEEGTILKYITETYPDLTRATDEQLMQLLPNSLKKNMVIDAWYQEAPYSQFDHTVPPSKQKTFQMLAKVLVTGDTTNYTPKHSPNTHWSNWLESGKL